MAFNKKFRIQNGVDITGEVVVGGQLVINADGTLVAAVTGEAVSSSEIDGLQSQIDAILGSSPEQLDTLQEIVAAFSSADGDLQTLISNTSAAVTALQTAIGSGSLDTNATTIIGAVNELNASIANIPAGPTGATGPQGPQGPQGLTGLQGQTGAAGVAGVQGSTGPQGPQGETGATGPAGQDGQDATASTPSDIGLPSVSESSDAVNVDADTIITGDLSLTGSLNLSGGINQYNVTDLDVADKTITVGHGQLESLSGGSGIVVDGSGASMLWNQSNQTWDLNKSLDVTGDVNTSGLLKVGTNDTEYANNYIRFKPTGASYIDHSVVGQSINFRLSNASSLDKTVMTLSSAGNVGIGTSSPSSYFSPQLVVHSSVNLGGITIRSNATTDTNYLLFADGTSGNERYRGYVSYDHNTDTMKLATGASPAITIDSSQNVGIGTSSPARLVDLKDSSNADGARLRLRSATGIDTIPTIGSVEFYSDDNSTNSSGIVGSIDVEGIGTWNGGSNNAAMTFNLIQGLAGTTSPVEAMRIDSAGRVGIAGQTNPTYNLDGGFADQTWGWYLNSSYNAGFTYNTTERSLLISTKSAENVDHIKFATGGAATERARIDGEGNLLVGKLTTDIGTQGIRLEGTKGKIEATRVGNVVTTFNRTGSAGTISEWMKDGAAVGSIGAAAGNLYIVSNDVGLNFAGGGDGIYPATANGAQRDAAIDLGASSHRFKNLYLSGAVQASYIYRADASGAGLHFTTNAIYPTNETAALSDGTESLGAAAYRFKDIFLSGEVIAGAGENSNPSITSHVDTDTGLFFGGADILGFSTGGAERARLDSAGRLGLGVTPEAWSSVFKVLRVGTGSSIAGESGGTSTWFNTNAYYDGSWKRINTNTSAQIAHTADGKQEFKVAASGSANSAISWNTAVTINNSGALLVGGTVEGPGAQSGISLSGQAADSNIYVRHANGTGSGSLFMAFTYNTSQLGSITQHGTSQILFNTTSDERAKENIVDAPSASDDIDAIQVRSFDWKADGSHQKYGMVAQELLEVAPESVSVPEDSEEMMGVDYSKLVPMLIKEIQSLRNRVAQLEE